MPAKHAVACRGVLTITCRDSFLIHCGFFGLFVVFVCFQFRMPNFILSQRRGKGKGKREWKGKGKVKGKEKGKKKEKGKEKGKGKDVHDW